MMQTKEKPEISVAHEHIGGVKIGRACIIFCNVARNCGIDSKVYKQLRGWQSDLMRNKVP
jgi:hypothetical protein